MQIFAAYFYTVFHLACLENEEQKEQKGSHIAVAVFSFVTSVFSLLMLFRRHVCDCLNVSLEVLSFPIWISLLLVTISKKELSLQRDQGIVVFFAQAAVALWALTFLTTVLIPSSFYLLEKCSVSRYNNTNDWSNCSVAKAQHANQ